MVKSARQALGSHGAVREPSHGNSTLPASHLYMVKMRQGEGKKRKQGAAHLDWSILAFRCMAASVASPAFDTPGASARHPRGAATAKSSAPTTHRAVRRRAMRPLPPVPARGERSIPPVAELKSLCIASCQAACPRRPAPSAEQLSSCATWSEDSGARTRASIDAQLLPADRRCAGLLG